MIILVLIVLGLIWGSFINAFVWRVHEGKDWVRGRSECTLCHHPLAPKDLIPVASWLILRGKCRYCGKPIKDSPIVELGVPLLFISSYLWWPWTLQGAGLLRFVLWLVFLVGFVILTVYDLRWKLLPNKVVYPLIVLAVLQVILLVIFYSAGVSAITGAAVGALIISGGFYLLFQVSAGKWIGGGDVKLGIVLGTLSGGAEQALLLLFIASFSGTLITLPLLLDKKLKAKATIPFGPFLLLAAVIVQLFGASLIRWYTHLVI